MNNEPNNAPNRVLSLTDCVAIIVGLVIGTGIFSFPAFVAGTLGDASAILMVWLAGGVVSIIGAWVLYEQDLTPTQLAGGVVVLAALGAILRRQRAERALAAEAALTGDLLDE